MTSSTHILGINAYHADAAACLLTDGRLVAAAEEERFCRVKHWSGFPARAIDYCLREAGIELEDVSHVAINQDSGAHAWRKVAHTATQAPDLGLVLKRLENRRRRTRLQEELAAVRPGRRCAATVHHVEHHLAHLASAYLVSPFDEALAVSIDGFGDFASVAWGLGQGGHVSVEGQVFFPHSLGIFYQAMTQHLGFPSYGDEYKVMGLAPYGEPAFLPQMRELVTTTAEGLFKLNLAYFRHHREAVDYGWGPGSGSAAGIFSPAIASLIGPARRPDGELTQRDKDLACSVQARYEEVLFHLLEHLYRRYRVGALALAGGCAQNSVANGKIYARTPFRRLYVQPAAGDAGGALGAALVAGAKISRGDSAHPPRIRMAHASWGPGYTRAQIVTMLEAHAADLAERGCAYRLIEDEGALCDTTAAAIAEGRVVGWFQGRMEWGPRALGNRSILCDPRRADMRDVLNVKIKRRETFRPFAPAILREAVRDWFEVDDDVPFMTQVYPIRADRRARIPAVTHVDGTGRLQTVTAAAHTRYYRLIRAFGDRTGVPIVLNTSFNENEPVVCTPEEALDCFLRTRMDVLVLNGCYVERACAAGTPARDAGPV